MEVSGRCVYKKAIKLTAEKMVELEKLVLQYSNVVEYDCTIKNGSIINFASLDEMLSYDNFSRKKITSLSITGRTDHKNITLDIDVDNFGMSAYGNTVVCKYVLCSLKDEKLFVSAFNELFSKCKQGYWLIAKLSLFHILVTISFSFICWIAITEGLEGFKPSDGYGIAFFLIAAIVFLFLHYGGLIFIRFVFPPLVFHWGEEVENYSTKNKRNRIIFGGIIGTSIMGLIINFISDKLTG